MTQESTAGTATDPSSYTVIDCDCHYLDSFAEIADYMTDPWKTRFKDSGWDEAGGKQNLSSFFPFSTGDRQAYGKIKREHSSYPDEPEEPENIRDGMDALGIDKTLLISHLVLNSGGVHADDERVAEFMKGYVRYALAEVLDPADGIYGLAPVPYYDIEASLDVLEMVADEESIKGVCFVTAGANPPLGNRKYDPIYDECENLDVPIVFHTGGSGLDEYLRAGYQEFIETHTLGFLESNMSQLVSLVVQGVPEKFPDLDIVFMESGVAYLPGLMARLDEEYLKRPEEAPLLEDRPSEYLRELYFGTQPLEISMEPEHLEMCIDMIGVDALMYASDYPHWDYDSPSTVAELPFLSRAEKQQILADNAAEVFDL